MICLDVMATYHPANQNNSIYSIETSTASLILKPSVAGLLEDAKFQGWRG
jgi:hypothetical protein